MKKAEDSPVVVQSIAFAVGGERVVANLYRPEATGVYPGVIVSGPMTSVKEQVTGVYAAALAQRGFAALALDHRHFGESEGFPRQYEHYHRKLEDLRAGVDALFRSPWVDPSRIAALGICLGAGYAAWASTRDSRIRALAMFAGYYRDPGELRTMNTKDFDAKVAQGCAARNKFEQTGEVLYIPAVALDGDAAMQTPDTFDYYSRRAAIPNYRNALAVMSREHFLPFDVQAAAPHIEAPVMMIHAERAISPQWARRFYAAVNTPKTLEWVIATGQTEFYDPPALVSKASDVSAAHFRRYLGLDTTRFKDVIRQ